MANKCVALLLVVCLTASAGVDAYYYPEPYDSCTDDCITYKCSNPPQGWCKFLCTIACASVGMNTANKVAMAEAPQSQASWAEAPQLSRKVQAEFDKEYKENMQSFHPKLGA